MKKIKLLIAMVFLVTNFVFAIDSPTNIQESTVSGKFIANYSIAGYYVILTKSGMTTIPSSVIIGDIKVSPAATTFITGLSLLMDPSDTFSTSTQIVGKENIL